jgi:hypothetical protein
MHGSLPRTALILILILLSTSSYRGQSTGSAARHDELAQKKNALASDIQMLDLESLKIDNYLARALAKAEIASAAWMLDPELARRLLREGYILTLPKDEATNLPDSQTGAESASSANNDRAVNEVRNRIIAVASRDKALAEQLANLGADRLGKSEAHRRYANLAAQAIQAGDTESASKYIIQSVDADPAQLTAPFQIISLAAKDRAAADKLIIQYIERLRAWPLPDVSQFLTRTGFLASLVFPPPASDRRTAPPGPPVMRAYVIYIIESLARMESQPESLQQARGLLMTAWMPLRQYAPELTGAFVQLESLSRRPGEDALLPTQKAENASKDNYQRLVKDALESGHPNDFAILSAISRGDFDNARKMIDMLDDGPRKTQLSESVNVRESTDLATKGDIVGAERLAKHLRKATSILNVYPTLVSKCVTKQDEACVVRLVDQAMKQLKSADVTPPTPLAGIPASFLPARTEFDAVLSGLFKLAKAVAPISDQLAIDVLDEAVRAANHSELDTKRGLTGMDVDVFRVLAAKDEDRVRQAAIMLKDRLRQVVALAAIYQSKAEQLAKIEKATTIIKN